MAVDALGLLSIASFFPRTLESLTVAELGKIKTALGLKLDMHEELREAGVALMQGMHIDTVADLIKSPEAVAELVSFMNGSSVPEALEPLIDEDFPPIVFL